MPSAPTATDPRFAEIESHRPYLVHDAQQAEEAVQEALHSPLDEEGETGDESWLDDLFDSTGHWRVAPQAWSNPEAAFEQRLVAAGLQELQAHLDKCFMCRT